MWGSGFRVQGVGCRDQGSGPWVWVVGCGVEGVGFRIWESVFRI